MIKWYFMLYDVTFCFGSSLFSSFLWGNYKYSTFSAHAPSHSTIHWTKQGWHPLIRLRYSVTPKKKTRCKSPLPASYTLSQYQTTKITIIMNSNLLTTVSTKIHFLLKHPITLNPKPHNYQSILFLYYTKSDSKYVKPI